MTIRWPCNVLRRKHPNRFDLASRSLAGPSSVSGKRQTVASDAGIWKATLAGVIIRKREHVLTFRAISTLLEGQIGTILIPHCRAYQPAPQDWRQTSIYDAVPHDDLSPFDDETEYQGSVITVVTTASAPARAVSLSVDVLYAGDIFPGQHFSIGERLYRIRSFDSETGELTFRPPLRESVEANTMLEFDEPVCRMRLSSDNEMDLPLEMNRYAEVDINLIEDI